MSIKSDETGKVNATMIMPGGDNQTGGARGGEALEDATSEEEQTQEQKTEETKEETTEDKKEIKFSDFLGDASERENLEDEATQKTEEKEEKEEEKTEERHEQVVDKKPLVKTKPTTGLPETRDFTGLSEDIIPVFKKMGNEPFAKLKPIFIEHSQQKETIKQRDAKIAELQKGVPILPDHYFEHPQGYLLDPVYAQEEANTDLAGKIVQHWSLQLARIRRGEQWQDLIEDSKTGKLSIDKPQAATSEAEAAVGGYLMATQQQLVEQKQKIREITTSFNARHKTDLELLQQGEKQYFPDFEKPEHPTAAIQKEVLKALPPSFRSSPLASVLAKTAAVNAMLRAELAELKKSKETNNNKSTVKKQPNKNSTGSASSSEQKKAEISYKDFQEILS